MHIFLDPWFTAIVPIISKMETPTPHSAKRRSCWDKTLASQCVRGVSTPMKGSIPTMGQTPNFSGVTPAVVEVIHNLLHWMLWLSTFVYTCTQLHTCIQQYINVHTCINFIKNVNWQPLPLCLYMSHVLTSSSCWTTCLLRTAFSSLMLSTILSVDLICISLVSASILILSICLCDSFNWLFASANWLLSSLITSWLLRLLSVTSWDIVVM